MASTKKRARLWLGVNLRVNPRRHSVASHRGAAPLGS